jgi:hypothetical protein
VRQKKHDHMSHYHAPYVRPTFSASISSGKHTPRSEQSSGHSWRWGRSGVGWRWIFYTTNKIQTKVSRIVAQSRGSAWCREAVSSRASETLVRSAAAGLITLRGVAPPGTQKHHRRRTVLQCIYTPGSRPATPLSYPHYITAGP